MTESREQRRPMIDEALAKAKFTNISEIPTDKAGIFLRSAKKDGEAFVIKGAETVKNGVDRIENQAIANAFLHQEVSGQAVDIPETSLLKDQGMTMAVMQKIEGETLADAKPEAWKAELMEKDVDALVDWLVAARKVPAEKIPEHFTNIARNVWNKEFYTGRLEQNAQTPLAAGTLTSDELQKLKDIWAQHFGPLTFQHHDFVPFNMMRSGDGKLWLIDGEFARLGMAGYDPAYFAIQTSCLYGKNELAASMLEKTAAAWKNNFPDDQLDDAILAPLAYRIVANLNDAPTQTDATVRDRTIRLKELILNDDLATIIEGLKSK